MRKKACKSFQKMKMKTIFYKSMFETILEDVGCVQSVILDVGCVRSVMLDRKIVWKMKIILWPKKNNRPLCLCVRFVCKTQDI